MAVTTLARADVLQLNPGHSVDDLSPYLYWRVDEQGSLSIRDVIRMSEEDTAWRLNDFNVPNHGFTRATYWFHLVIHNRHPKAIERILEVHSALLSEVNVFLVVEGVVIQYFGAGNSIEFTSRPIAHRHPVFPLVFAPETRADLYLQVRSATGMQLPLSLWQERDFWIRDQQALAWQFSYYGLMLVMVLYNVFLAWGTRDSIYVYYVVFTAGIWVFQMILHGTAFQYLWPGAPQWNALSIAVFIPLTNALSTLFINKLLRLAQHAPFAYRLLLLQVMSAPVLMVAPLLLPMETVVPVSTLMVVLSGGIVLVVSIKRWRAHDIDARYFLVAWIVFVLGCQILALNKAGVLPYNWLTENLMQIGSATETILLSLALTGRINRMREERMLLKREQLQAREQAMKAEKSVLEAKYESKAKSEFLAVMSHEIRTPMNGVLGVVELLRDTPLNEKQSELVDTIQSSGKLLLNIINDILDYSKIESGKLEFETIEFNPRQLLEEAIRFQFPAAQQKGLLVAAFVDPQLPDVLQGDPSRIKQVLYNLMSNAIKFTASGHLFLRARSLASDEGCQVLRIEVLDSGIGLTAEQKDRLFQSFTQADRSTSRKFGGTGLGLAISKKLVEAMGGTIGVDSALRFGSCFWFELPLLTEGEPVAETEPAPLSRQHWYFVSDYVPLLEFIETSLDKKRFTMHSIIVRDKEVDWPDADIVGRNVLAYLRADGNGTQQLHWGTLDAIRGIVEHEIDVAVEGKRNTESRRAGVTTETAPFFLDVIFSKRQRMKESRPATVLVAPSRGSNLQHLRVLVAEDNAVNQMVVRGLLRPLVGDVDMVSNGREALEKVKSASHPYDLIFMDCEMPEMDGYEATRCIREHEQRTDCVRPAIVVALTAHAFDEFREKAYDCGMNGHLSKPVTRDMLYQFLSQHYGHLLALDQRSPRLSNDSSA